MHKASVHLNYEKEFYVMKILDSLLINYIPILIVCEPILCFCIIVFHPSMFFILMYPSDPVKTSVSCQNNQLLLLLITLLRWCFCLPQVLCHTPCPPTRQKRRSPISVVCPSLVSLPSRGPLGWRTEDYQPLYYAGNHPRY